jgi:Fur family peroxide stress response transcriptional regulator
MSHVDILKLHTLKATPQRLCVLEVLKNYGHATLEEIEKSTKIKFPTLSLSTIYRNLNEMLKKGILSEVKLANKKEYYEITKDDHAHLVCTKCGKIEDFQINTDEIIKKAQASTCSKIYSTTISFENICEECLSSK